MTNEAASLLEQIVVLELEIETRALMRSVLMGEVIKYIQARKIECGYLADSPSAKKWDELENSVSVGDLLAIVDFLVQSRKTVSEFVETWQLHGDLRLALRVLARSTTPAASRFHPTNN